MRSIFRIVDNLSKPIGIKIGLDLCTEPAVAWPFNAALSP